jgi:hypothetical protein
MTTALNGDSTVFELGRYRRYGRISEAVRP